jgi:predicted lactoylglutathione lyase
MARKTFVNLAIKDVQRSRDFFAALGFTFNEQFSDEKAFCMIVSEEAFVMMLSEPFFKGFTPNEVADATKVTEVLVCVSADSRAEVDQMITTAIAKGGREPREAQDHGFMYNRAFQDLDGHIWEIVWMDMSGMPQEQ